MNRPDLLDEPPQSDTLTEYDRAYMKHYLRLVDADLKGSDWRRAVRIVLGINPEADPERARRIHQSHLKRGHWMYEEGYREQVRADTGR